VNDGDTVVKARKRPSESGGGVSVNENRTYIRVRVQHFTDPCQGRGQDIVETSPRTVDPQANVRGETETGGDPVE